MTATRGVTVVAVLALWSLSSGDASAQKRYNQAAARSAPTVRSVEVHVDPTTGEKSRRVVTSRPARDGYGNASGNQYDLAVDGAFEGETIVVLQFYTMESTFDFELPRQALKQKGFSVYRYQNKAPSPGELAEALAKANQLWIIADSTQRLNSDHLGVIQKFFDAGHGVYIWGDNQPYYSDANYVASALLGVKMSGNLMGNKTVKVLSRGQTFGKVGGVLRDHLLTTGLEYVYEGITIATIENNDVLTPLIYGSAGNLVTAFYDKGGKRAILDGGFTRLYNQWDTAGTARYVKNAAAWLSNEERFGSDRVQSIGAASVNLGRALLRGARRMRVLR